MRVGDSMLTCACGLAFAVALGSYVCVCVRLVLRVITSMSCISDVAMSIDRVQVSVRVFLRFVFLVLGYEVSC